VAVYGILFFLVFPAIFTNQIKRRAEKGTTRESNGPVATLHFALLFLYSTVCFFATLLHIVNSGQATSFQAFACEPVPPSLRILSLTFIVSKLWEWGDTITHFSKGQTGSDIGFLHSYHHATTFFLFLLVTNFPGTEKSGMLLNGFVHSLMYYHFAFRLPKWARPIITVAQIVQLVLVTALWSVTPETCKEYSSWPSEFPIEFALPYLMVPVYTLFFIKFFFTSYLRCGKSKTAGKKE
jgi:hypothetical protein